jgi:polysaccharide transporter, PST family
VIQSNTIHLSVLKGLELLAPLLTIPWLIHSLGLAVYGQWVLVLTVCGYLAICIGYGFEETATRRIATWTGDSSGLNAYVSSVLQTRLLLLVACASVYLIAVWMLARHPWVWTIALLVLATEALNTTWYYHAIGRLDRISASTLLSRMSYLGLVVLFIHQPGDLERLPWLLFLTQSISIVPPLLWLRSHGVALHPVSFRSCRERLHEGFSVFASNLVIACKDRTAHLVLGIEIGTSQLALYDLLTKGINLVCQPAFILNNAYFPSLGARNCKATRRQLIKWLIGSGLVMALIIFAAAPWGLHHLFPQYAHLKEPIQITALAPLFYGMGLYYGKNVLILRGQTGKLLSGMLLTSGFYLCCLALLAFMNRLTLPHLTALFVFTYLIEWLIRYGLSVRNPPSHAV